MARVPVTRKQVVIKITTFQLKTHRKCYTVCSFVFSKTELVYISCNYNFNKHVSLWLIKVSQEWIHIEVIKKTWCMEPNKGHFLLVCCLPCCQNQSQDTDIAIRYVDFKYTFLLLNRLQCLPQLKWYFDGIQFVTMYVRTVRYSVC